MKNYDEFKSVEKLDKHEIEDFFKQFEGKSSIEDLSTEQWEKVDEELDELLKDY